MRKFLSPLFVFVMMLALVFSVSAAPKVGTTIQDGILKYSAGHYLAGQPLKVGNDIFGYNYQAHEYSGSYVNAYLGGYGYPPYEGDDDAYLATNPSVVGVWCWPYRNDYVAMKWNDAWLSNMDMDKDGKLDRHYGFTSYVGSGAWETNHQKGTNADGTKWTYFVKIVAVPSDAVKVAGVWYTPAGVEIGPDIWGEFATIQEVYNDSSTGEHGILYKSPASPGFGKW